MAEQIELWGVEDPNISSQLALAHKLDMFKREAGLDVACKFVKLGTTMADDILDAEKKPFAFTQTPITALLLHDKGLSTKLVAPLADIAGSQQVIIRKSSGISEPKDLKGKQIGIVEGAAIHLALRNMARACNVDLNTVHFVNLLPQEQLEAFESGKLDVIASWEPWTTKARTMGGDLYFSGTRSEIPGIEGDTNWLINQSCLIILDAYLETQPEVVVAILNVLRKATDLINYHRDKVIEPLAELFGINRVELMIAMQKNRYSLAVNGAFRLGILMFRDYLYDTGQISSKFSEDLLYDTTLLRQVDPSLVSLETPVSWDVSLNP